MDCIAPSYALRPNAAFAASEPCFCPIGGGNNGLTTNQLASYKPAVGVPRERLQQVFFVCVLSHIDNQTFIQYLTNKTKMNKKKYLSPTMKVVEVNAQQMICTSPGVKTEVLVEEEFEW